MKTIYLKIKKNWIAAGLSAVVLTSGLTAAEKNSMDTYELDQLVVTASRLEMPLDQVGSKVDILGEFELEKGNTTFLLDNLRELPGVFVRNTGGPGGSFGITTRGLNETRPVVLIDGIEVSAPSDGMIMNPGLIFAGNVATIEFLKGPQSSLYGANAIGGVLNIITKDEHMAPGGALAVSYGAHRTYDASILYREQIGDVALSVGLATYESEGISTLNPDHGSAWADNDGYENDSAMVKGSYEISKQVSAYFIGYYIHGESEFDPSWPAWGIPAVNNESETEQIFGKSGLRYVLSDQWEGDVNVAYTSVDNRSTSDGELFQSDGERWKFDTRNVIKASDWYQVVTGVEYENEKAKRPQLERDNLSLYVENVVEVIDGLDLTLGGRFDDNSDYGTETTWRTTGSYQIPGSTIRLHGAYGTSFQAPTFDQLYGIWGANPSLKPEKGKGWDMGISAFLWGEKIHADVTYFNYEIEDKIVWVTDPITFMGKYENANVYESSGIETSLEANPVDSIRIRIAYTYSKGEENGVEAIRVPRNVYSASFTWLGLDHRLSLTAQTLIVSSQLTSPYSTLAGGRNPGYAVLNLAARYEVSEMLTVWARLDNALDRDYEEIADYETAGASLYAGVKVSF